MKPFLAWVEENRFPVGLLLVCAAFGGSGEILFALKAVALVVGGLLLLSAIVDFVRTLRVRAASLKPPADSPFLRRLRGTTTTTWRLPVPRKPPAQAEEQMQSPSAPEEPPAQAEERTQGPPAPVPEMPRVQAEELLQALKESLARKAADREQAAAKARQAEMFDLMRQAHDERKAKGKPDGEPS